MSYTGDLRLLVGTADDEDDKSLGPDIDQATFDGKHLSMNGYDRVWKLIEPSEGLELLNDSINDFVPNGRGRRLQYRHWSWRRRSFKAVFRKVTRLSKSFALSEFLAEHI